ncbi:hypothetical protein EMPG_15980 [Blastomyces silverae]|uniref:Aminoglycoside phosphotransferase domain-containing protein n=1 Tax=Blastomyces silverae TaxID=2060906 RepID=A0A0H1BC30_9EURO|nr:hypothetical protein EMPG_15980 [Blastomyces silverae]
MSWKSFQRATRLNDSIFRGYRKSTRFFSFLSFRGGRDTPARNPELYIEKPDGTEERAIEEDLFKYSRHRWIFNEEKEVARRYRKFDLQKLIEVAIDTAGDGAQSCTKVLKCVEGLHNKALLLTMDNGKEVFAKLPNSNAGPARYVTASEVATREFLREVVNVPVPRVFAWSCDPANPVGAEYIVEEKAPGTRLGSLWHDWPRKSKLRVIDQVGKLEHALTTTRFTKHGCLYFKQDLPTLKEQNDTLLVEPFPSVQSADLDRYVIGPLTRAELWSSGREDIDLDRGPWRRPEDYARAIGKNEVAWIEKYASPRINYYVSPKESELPNQALALLSKYLKVAPYLVPSDNDSEAVANVLWHPDLHLDNIFVDPATCQITGIIDWQSASIAPMFYQSCIPRMFRHDGPVREGWVVPERPDNFDSLSEEEQTRMDQNLESERMHKFYEAMVYKHAPNHWEVLQRHRDIQLKRNPTWLVTGVWENRDLFFLRQSLIAIVALWDTLPHPNSTTKCPINFTRAELDLHGKEDENMTGVGNMLKLFRDKGVLPVDGMVDPEDYEAAKANSVKFKEIFVGLAKDEEERELFNKLWPYQDQESG